MNRNLTLALDISGAILFSIMAYLFTSWGTGWLFVAASLFAVAAFVVSVLVGVGLRQRRSIGAGWVWIGRGLAFWSALLFILAIVVQVIS